MKCSICNKRPAAKHRTICGTCKTQKYRRENPMRAAYMALRDNAKRRGKAFDLTFEDFQVLAIETDYIIKKGRSKLSYTLDRDKNELGYTKDNIKVLTNSDNVKKEHERRRVMKVKYAWETREYWSADITPRPLVQYESPF